MHHYISIILTIFITTHPLLVLSSASSACYFPDGSLITNDSPCFPDQEDSMCCGYGHSCMSNGMCRWPDSAMPDPLVYIRGSCTDKSWNSDKCPPQCDKQYPSSFDPVIGCPNGQYCCQNDSLNPGSCCDKNDLFPLPAATTVTVIGLASWVTSAVGVPTGVQTDPAGFSTGTSTTTTSPSSPSHSSSAPASSGSTSKTVVTSSVSTTATATATANTASASSTSHVTSKPSIAASSTSQASPTLTSTSGAAFGICISLPATLFAFAVSLRYAFN